MGLVSKSADLSGLYKQQLSSDLSEDIDKLDNRRDASINGLQLVVEGFQYHYKPDFAKATTQLANNLKLYGTGIARQNLQAETTIITNLVNDGKPKPI